MPSKISELAKRGIFYTPLEATAPEQAEEDGDFVRGLKKAGHQIPQTAGGAVALVGDLIGSDGMREYGMDVYQKRADQIQAISKPTDSLSSVLEGAEDTSAADWLQNSAGYVTGQVGTALVTGGVGGFIGKQLAKRGISHIIERGATSAAAKQVAEKVATRGARAGALSGIMGLNLVQEAGSIYPDAVHHAESEGRVLDGGDKARVVADSFLAAGVDTVTDAVMLGRVMVGGRKAGESMIKAARRELPLAMAREGVTEGIQTAIERHGAGKELTTADAVREYVDSIGVGMVGGGMGGALSVLHSQKVPDGGPLSRAANTAIDQEILALTNDPDPMVAFPDGSVGTKAQVAAWLKQFPEENGQRNEARAKLLGLDGKTGEPLPPEPIEPEPEPEFAATPDEEQVKLSEWAAEHEPATLDYAHSLLAAPGMKGKNMMVAPHPDGEGYTVVPANWLTLDTQATLGELQKPVKAKEGESKPAAKPEPAAAPAPAAEAAPAEPEWKTNPYTAYKFADLARAEQFMVNKKADPALFEIQPAGDLFVIKRKAAQGESNDSGLAAVHQNGRIGAGDGGGIAAGPAGTDGLGTQPADAPVEQRPAVDGAASAADELDPVHATTSADADPALEAAAETGPINLVRLSNADNFDWKKSKPNGTYASIADDPATFQSPFAEEYKDGKRHDLQYEPKNPLVVGDLAVKHARFKGALNGSGETSAGVKALHAYLPREEFDHALTLTKGQVQAEIQQRFPDVDTSKAYDSYEALEIWGAQEAKQRGHDIIIARDSAMPQFSEAVLLDGSNTEDTTNVPEPAQVPEEAPPAQGAQSKTQPTAERDTGAGIPKAFYKKVKVAADVHVEETGATESVDIPADKALASVREDIANLQALLKCMKGGA